MVRQKLGAEFDVDDLDVDDWEDGGYEEYEGEDPPKNVHLLGRVTKVWKTESSNGDVMFKSIFTAEGNTGKLAQYNGWTGWDNITFVKTAAFRYQPFLLAFNLSVRDIKNKMDVGDEEKMGDRIESIADWRPGSDDSWCYIVTKRERFGDEWTTKIKTYEPGEPPEDEDEEEERPARRSRRAEAPVKSSRRRQAQDGDEDEDGEPPARTSRRSGSTRRGAATSRRGAGAAGDDPFADEEPF
jgi:hypothetical protein